MKLPNKEENLKGKMTNIQKITVIVEYRDGIKQTYNWIPLENRTVFDNFKSYIFNPMAYDPVDWFENVMSSSKEFDNVKI